MSNRFSIKVENLSKVFPGTKALDNVSLQFEAGKSYALVGENGAGKSTLVRILSGDLQQTEGTIYLNGESWNSISPKNAENYGIIRVPQEPSIITDLSVAENIFLGHPPKKGLLVSYRLMKKEAEKLLQKIGVNLKVTMDAGDLSVANQQMMLIAAALAHDVKLIIFDEPTASITESEAKILFKIMHELKRKGVSIIFISHRMEEVFEVCDHAYVLRDGVKVGDIPTSKTDVRSLINMMVGRDVSYQRMQGKAKANVLLEVKDLYKKATFKNISFKLHEGEILGIAGLMGSGRSEIARAIFGADKLDFGEIWIDGKKVRIRSPKEAIDLGIGFATEDRKEQGLFLIKSVMFNISFVIRKKNQQFRFHKQ